MYHSIEIAISSYRGPVIVIPSHWEQSGDSHHYHLMLVNRLINPCSLYYTEVDKTNMPIIVLGVGGNIDTINCSMVLLSPHQTVNSYSPGESDKAHLTACY